MVVVTNLYTNPISDMRRDVQEIFRKTPTHKQVMMFSATLSKETIPVCKKFMQNPVELLEQSEAKLSLDGLRQYYVKLTEAEKNRKLNELLDTLTFNQVIIFVKSTVRATELDKLLKQCGFPSVAVHSGVSQEERCVDPYDLPIKDHPLTYRKQYQALQRVQGLQHPHLCRHRCLRPWHRH